MVSSILSKSLRTLHSILFFLSILIFIEVVITNGFFIEEPFIVQWITAFISGCVIIIFLVWVFLRVISSPKKYSRVAPDIILSLLVISSFLSFRACGGIIAFRIILWHIFSFLFRVEFPEIFTQARLNPARVLVLSFFGMIILGTSLLLLPAATVDHKGASIIDAFFTATSATCVTGLTVQDTGRYFSLFGQCVILTLIQIGGLGIMTFSTLFAILLGRRLGLKYEEHLRGIMDQKSTLETYKLIMQIIRITLALECTGFFFLFIRWFHPMGWKTAFYYALFHSISAFCNAGFSLFSQNLAQFVEDFSVNTVIIFLIITGGLGFVVLNDILMNCPSRNPLKINWMRLNVHSKLVLITTGILILSGAFSVFFFEFDNTMLSLSVPHKMLASVFQSVTCRTAGYNTLDIGSMRDVTLFICIILMFIGASPASTGGGIKTTTLAILFLSIRSLLVSKDQVEIFHRTISPQTIYKSIAITLFSFSFIFCVTILLLATQEGGFIDILFETTSAIGTVGLSTGMTGKLNGIGKVVISLLMYVGRVGPLTVALALGEVHKVNIRYPTTSISVG